MSLHFSLPKIRTFRFSLHTSRLSLHGEVTMVALKFAMSLHFPLPKIFSPSGFVPPSFNNCSKLGLVRIRHGVSPHAMKSRVCAYKNRAKGSGWQANWREHFCHSLTLKTSVFPLSIRLIFGPITSPTIKKSTSAADLDSNQEVGGGAKASGCRMLEWWSSGKKALRTDSLLFTRCSLRTLSFYLIRHKNDYIVRFRCKYQFFLFFTTCHISLFQVDLGSHWTCWTETRCITPVWKAQTDGQRSAWQGISSLAQASFVFDFFLLNSTENFRVLVSRPRKKKAPHTGCFFGDWLHEDRTKQRFRSVDSPTLKCEARPGSFWRGRFLFHSSLIFLHTWHIHYSFIFHTWNRFFLVSFTVTLSIFLLLETPRPGFSPRWASGESIK